MSLHRLLSAATLSGLLAGALLAPTAATSARVAPAPAPAPARLAPGAPALLYTFVGFTTNGRVYDRTGAGHHAATKWSGGGTIRPVARGTDRAALFPAPCHKGTCPRAILETPHRAELNPGTRAFRYGATLLLSAARTSVGSNVVQKGFYNSVTQWKLQVDGRAGRPSCVLVGGGKRYLARSNRTVADSRWHAVECRRSGTWLAVVIDARVTGTTRVPLGLKLANTSPVRIGGNGPGRSNDQYFGALDDVFFRAS